MVFVNGTTCSKGEALLAFFKRINFYPQKVIFVDDREENLKSVEAALSQLDSKIEFPIEFQGLHFLGALKYPSEPLTAEQFEARWQSLTRNFAP